MKRAMWIWAAVGGAAGTLLLMLLILMGTVYTGAYNVAATDGHTPFARWALSTNMQNAVAARAPDAEETPEFTQAMITAGASEYKAMCQHCHAGPGVERADWAQGMLPLPPHLTEAAAEWSPEQIHWIVRNGVKMTGMPAFGPTHDDKTVWSIAAFVKALPAMTPQAYASYSPEHGDGHAGGHADEDS